MRACVDASDDCEHARAIEHVGSRVEVDRARDHAAGRREDAVATVLLGHWKVVERAWVRAAEDEVLARCRAVRGRLQVVVGRGRVAAQRAARLQCAATRGVCARAIVECGQRVVGRVGRDGATGVGARAVVTRIDGLVILRQRRGATVEPGRARAVVVGCKRIVVGAIRIRAAHKPACAVILVG